MTTFFSFLRVKQWVKNIFVLAPLLFSRKWLSLDTARWDILDALLGFCTFCLISSAVYVLNDIMDIRQDRLHPVKKRRPLASGAVSLRMAVVCAISLCVCAAFFIIIIGNLMAAFWAIVYFALMILYSVWLKNVPLVDVVAIAAGFMIRVVFGAAVICVDASPFILLTTGALSLFLGVSKRKAELIRMKNMTYTRNVLAFYTPERTTILLSVLGILTSLCYLGYTLCALPGNDSPALIFSTIFVVVGLWRYAVLLHKPVFQEDPTEALLSDRWLFACCALYLIYVIFIFWAES